MIGEILVASAELQVAQGILRLTGEPPIIDPRLERRQQHTGLPYSTSGVTFGGVVHCARSNRRVPQPDQRCAPAGLLGRGPQRTAKQRPLHTELPTLSVLQVGRQVPPLDGRARVCAMVARKAQHAGEVRGLQRQAEAEHDDGHRAGQQQQAVGLGVQGTLGNPQLRLYRGSEIIAQNDDWSTGADSAALAAAFQRLGAFALAEVNTPFWVGDGAFDMRNQRTLRAFVKVLKAAKVDFAVLGLEERDSGDVARRLGDEATFQLLAKRNIATLAKYQFKRIVTCDPHSFHVLKNEYGELGGRYSVLHHSTYMDELISGQKLNLGQHKGGSVTYHDPCYLGRYNGEYEAPRNVLNAIGIEVKEMQRSGFRSRCCGGGGGAPITDIPGKQRIPDMRMVDIKETAAELVAVGCPQCTAMLEGVVGPRPEVKDIAELVADVLIEGVVEVKKPASVPREAAEVSP